MYFRMPVFICSFHIFTVCVCCCLCVLLLWLLLIHIEVKASFCHWFRVYSEASSSQAAAAPPTVIATASHTARCVLCIDVVLLSQGTHHTFIYKCDTFHHGLCALFFSLQLLSFICWPGTFFFLYAFRLFVSMIQCITLTMFTRCSPLFFTSLHRIWSLLPLAADSYIFVFVVVCSFVYSDIPCVWFGSVGRCYTYFSHIVHWIHIICFILYKFWINTKPMPKQWHERRIALWTVVANIHNNNNNKNRQNMRHPTLTTHGRMCAWQAPDLLSEKRVCIHSYCMYNIFRAIELFGGVFVVAGCRLQFRSVFLLRVLYCARAV